jgi:hypothetical protein
VKKWLLVGVLMVSVALVAAVLVWRPWSSQPAAEGSISNTATGDGWSATASFSDAPALRARVERADLEEKQKAVLPATTTLRGLADFNVEGGDFPISGAKISFTVTAPLSGDRLPVIAHWNESSLLWEPVETAPSEDRRTATASVSHFSEYGFFDWAFNVAGQITGNAATSGVTCDRPIPAWADPQFFEDINSPVLWCGGKDSKNGDILVAKLKMNRDTAAKISLAIDSTWAWSDLWQGAPIDLATMADSSGVSGSTFGKREYMVQPFGEMHFGFSRAALEAHYYGGPSQPLVEVESGWFYTAAAIVWAQIGSLSSGDSPVAAASSAMAMMNCGRELITINSGTGAVDAFGKAMTCLGTQKAKDQLHRGVRTVLADRYPHLTDGWITVHSQPILSKFAFVGTLYSSASLSLKVFSAAGDATLPENVRQFRFTPSLEALKSRVAEKKTYKGSFAGTDYSFTYPAGWKVKEAQASPYFTLLEVINEQGVKMANLNLLSTWDATGAGNRHPVVAQSDLQSTGTMSAMGADRDQPMRSKFLVRTVTMDLTGYPDDATAARWTKPVAVAVSAGGWQEPAKDLAPFHLSGIGFINVAVTGSPQPFAVVEFQTNRYFDTVAAADVWKATSEYRNVVNMIASFTG